MRKQMGRSNWTSEFKGHGNVSSGGSTVDWTRFGARTTDGSGQGRGAGVGGGGGEGRDGGA